MSVTPTTVLVRFFKILQMFCSVSEERVPALFFPAFCHLQSMADTLSHYHRQA